MKYFYTLIVLICLSGIGQSQINSYFNNNPCWQIQYKNEIASNCYKTDLYNYFINGDTVIGSYQYKKVYKKGTHYLQCYCPVPPPTINPCFAPPPPTIYGAGLSFFIRSVGKKVYVRNATNMICTSCSGDTLLYDFNLKVGDTLPKTMNNPSFSPFIVTVADSILTSNGWMKAFKLNGNPNYNFIEGMGYSAGLIEPMPIMLCNCASRLECYSQNNTSYYPASGPSCLLPTGIKEIPNSYNPIIYPNPSEGKYFIWIPDFSTNSKIEIYDLNGQLIRSYSPISESLELDIQKEKDGIYLLKYISNGETKSVKLVKE